MNKFVSRCRHLLVSFIIHAMTSLHPPSFHRNDFSTCHHTVGDIFYILCRKRACAFFYHVGCPYSFQFSEEEDVQFREFFLRWLSCV